jgi:hypothetical protein
MKLTTISSLQKYIFKFLNDLRDSGATNMFGASPYIVSEFGITKLQARETLSLWMENFNENGYEHLKVNDDEK